MAEQANTMPKGADKLNFSHFEFDSAALSFQDYLRADCLGIEAEPVSVSRHEQPMILESTATHRRLAVLRSIVQQGPRYGRIPPLVTGYERHLCGCLAAENQGELWPARAALEALCEAGPETVPTRGDLLIALMDLPRPGSDGPSVH